MINISLHIRKLPPATVCVCGEGGGILKSNTQSAKICLNFNWGGGVLKSNTQSAKICLNFNFRGGGEGGYSGTKFQNRGVMENLDKNLLFEVNCTETCLCITDSLSHTTYVETNQDLSCTLIITISLFGTLSRTTTTPHTVTN